MLIADIDEQVTHDADFRVCAGGNMQPHTRHQHQQADRFHRNGFAAGVRPGDNQHIKALAEFDLQRHDALAVFGISEFFQQKRVAGRVQHQATAIVDRWRIAVKIAGKMRFGLQRIQRNQRMVIDQHGLAHFSCLFAQLS